MGKPIAFFMVVMINNRWTRLFGWLLPKKIDVVQLSRKGKKVPFRAKVGSGYTLESRNVDIAYFGLFRKLYKIKKFSNMSQLKRYCGLQKMKK